MGGMEKQPEVRGQKRKGGTSPVALTPCPPLSREKTRERGGNRQRAGGEREKNV